LKTKKSGKKAKKVDEVRGEQMGSTRGEKRKSYQSAEKRYLHLWNGDAQLRRSPGGL